ncbi:MAG: hypothetical protein HY561_13625, partial [Gemmatimonadetes bacterium]|nr:hypothetical protein [Gemmatimonadota bacterium]
MSTSSFWTRVRQARLFRVIAVYLGVSWVILQVASVLRDALSLPAWVSPVAVLLLLIGLAIIVMTAWVQSHPATAQKAEADQVPGRWELDVAEIKRSLAKGEVPHPTWARAILGGVFAFSLLFGVAGVYVVIKDRGQSYVPEPALAAAAPGIAVLPFDVKGEGLDVWREGMVDLLATNLDGVAGLRAIDSRTVLASWRDHVPGTGMPALRQSLEVADGIGARYALVGSAVAIGGGVRLAADVYDVASGSKLGLAHVEGSPDSVLALVDRFSVEIVRAILQQRGGEVPPIHGLATLTTASLPALKAYLEGEALYRRSSFERATAAYERAAAADTGFALAYMRLA